PLHERDTSVAIKGSSQRRHYYALFQSPSRGGHLRGGSGAGGGRGGDLFQSPSRGGHLRGGDSTRPHGSSSGFIPLHEGDSSVALCVGVNGPAKHEFQSPSRGGHLRGLAAAVIAMWAYMFQSPSRGGHLRGTGTVAASWSGTSVSVPFTRGTPPWHWYLTAAGGTMFQSPSRGGHLRGGSAGVARDKAHLSFSPLHEGDTSVAARPRPLRPRV